MYAYLKGTLVSRKPAVAVLDVGGVGYEIQTTLATSRHLPEPGGEVLLHIHPSYREDRVTLFGFATGEEKEFFLLLISIAGIGPKLAQTILSGVTLESLAAAILSGDEKTLVSIPGVGRKMAQRLAVELREPLSTRAVGPSDEAEPGVAGDAVGALVTLGYPRARAFDAVRRAREKSGGGDTVTLEELIREALRII